MSFRRRVVLLAAVAVAAAVVIASAVVYVVTRDELRGQLDASLRERVKPGPQSLQVEVPPGARTIGTGGHASEGSKAGASRAGSASAGSGSFLAPAPARQTQPAPTQAAPGGAPAKGTTLGSSPGGVDETFIFSSGRPVTARNKRQLVKLVLPTQGLGGSTGYAQLVRTDGKLLGSSGPAPRVLLPITSATRQVAAGKRSPFFTDATVAHTQMRVLTAPFSNGVLQVAMPLTEVNRTLSQLRLVLLLVSFGGVALAAALGLLVSRAALVPVRRLTGAAEDVARTQDLGHRIADGENGELGRLAASFNTMLAALERSRESQRQLVSDASHELRTPLTSVSANLDALAAGAAVPPAERASIVAAARAQLRELGVLVEDLVDLSKTYIEDLEFEDVRLDLAVAHAVQRARLHAPSYRFELDAAPCLVRAVPARLDRAIANLLDNAVKWSPSGGPVEVLVRDGCVQVRDRGPGIAAADLPRVFDRFYRAADARGLPGSGLGLAIVRQVAETHGGSVRAANDPGGGARLTLALPALAMTASETLESMTQTPRAGAREPIALHQVPPSL